MNSTPETNQRTNITNLPLLSNSPCPDLPSAAPVQAPATQPPATDAPAPAAPPVCQHTRNGKIARLPYLERDMVNRLLRNNIPYASIVAALKERHYCVTPRNVSNWKTRGGYKEWCLEQDRAVQTRLFQDNLLEHLRKNDAGQIPEVGLQLAAASLSRYFANPDTLQQLAAAPEKFARSIVILCRLAGQIHSLQKYRDDTTRSLGYSHNPARVKLAEEEQADVTRSSYTVVKRGKQLERHRNFLPRNP
jgi:hypothetical protein